MKKDWEYLINEVYGGDISSVPLEYGKRFFYFVAFVLLYLQIIAR